MEDYLKFPQENYIGKRLSKEQYIKFANLTNAEKKPISAYLDFIQILYSFHFDDGKIIVLLAEYTSVEYSKCALNDFVKAIAQSLPYRIMLIVRCEGVIHFFVFNEKINENDNRRSKVLSVKSSLDIIPLENDYSDNHLITLLSEAVNEATSAKDLNEQWYSILLQNSGNSFYDDSPIDNTFPSSVEEYHRLEKDEIELDLLTSQDFNEVDDCSFYHENLVNLDMDEIEHKLFAEFCAYHSRLLFDEFSTLYTFSENNWLKIYFDGCDLFAKDIFARELGNKAKKIISKAFWYGDDDYTEAADCYDVYELKERICNCYLI